MTGWRKKSDKLLKVHLLHGGHHIEHQESLLQVIKLCDLLADDLHGRFRTFIDAPGWNLILLNDNICTSTSQIVY